VLFTAAALGNIYVDVVLVVTVLVVVVLVLAAMAAMPQRVVVAPVALGQQEYVYAVSSLHLALVVGVGATLLAGLLEQAALVEAPRGLALMVFLVSV
jgi:hypothetical protein